MKTRKSFIATILALLAAPFCRASKVNTIPAHYSDWMTDPEVIRLSNELSRAVRPYSDMIPRTRFTLESSALGMSVGMETECEDLWNRRKWRKKWGPTPYPGDEKKASELTEVWTKERQDAIQNILKAIARGGNITLRK